MCSDEICALTGDGLNMTGIRRVLQLQEQTRQLQAELDRLRKPAAGQAGAGALPAPGCLAALSAGLDFRWTTGCAASRLATQSRGSQMPHGSHLAP